MISGTAPATMTSFGCAWLASALTLGAQCAAVVVLAGLTPWAFAGARTVIAAAHLVAGIHVLNGLFHVCGAVVSRRAVPGIWSAPLLVVAGVWLWSAGWHLH